jgi:hypothetical protein
LSINSNITIPTAYYLAYSKIRANTDATPEVYDHNTYGQKEPSLPRANRKLSPWSGILLDIKLYVESIK